MLFAIIVALIIGLVIVAIVANSVQQQKEKLEAERRQEMNKFRAIITETEEVIVNDAGIPISAEGYQILYGRIIAALKGMNETTPGQKDIMNRIASMTEKLETGEFPVIETQDVVISDNEKLLIGIIQGIKKYRMILRSEHGKGRIPSSIFSAEDKKVEKLQLKIGVETQMKRGKKAMKNHMAGSARQYFEKALHTLEAQPYTDEYISSRKEELEDLLEQITQELANANADSVKKKKDAERDDLDELFAPKKKW